MFTSKHVAKFLMAMGALVLAACAGSGLWRDTGDPQRNRPHGAQAWSIETLANGLRVIYAPMPSSPTTHVSVIYHVGSRDERPDRQGFAHMFEHMMFRGSAHVAPEEHMKLINGVGGYSNAYTSFDQTVYVNTVPATYTEMALWLEADRMASFKVSPDIFHTERKVVEEEYGLRLNQPYGTTWDQLMPVVFTRHSYRWTPIGNMAHLAQAQARELQEFFDQYYVPNNAILVIAGKINVSRTRDLVQKYYGWIPAPATVGASSGAGGMNPPPPAGQRLTPVARNIPAEPPQTAPRRLEITMPVPLARIILAWHMPPAVSDDIEPLGLLLGILGDGRSSRLSRALVTDENPLCVSANAIGMDLQDGGVMGAMATALGEKSVADVEKAILAKIAELREQEVTADELEKVKQQERLRLAQRFETAEDVAGELGDELMIRGHLDRIHSARERLEAITAADLLRVARRYFTDQGVTTMVIQPGTPPALPPATNAAAELANASSAAALPARPVSFPPGYPTAPPMSGKLPDATFDKGVESTIALPGAGAPVRVIVMEDHRMPIVNWTLTLRAGGHAEPPGKEGVAALTAGMVRRGPRGKSYDAFNEELESRAISLEVSDGGDLTRISGSCLSEQLPSALAATRQMALTPAFDPGEFARLKNQALSSLRLSLNNPQTVASRELTRTLFGDSPLGRLTTVASLSALTLDDVKDYYQRVYRGDGAILMICGDISVQRGRQVAGELLAGFPAGNLPQVAYDLPGPSATRRILLVDRQEGRQSAIRMGIRAYDIHSQEKFAGSLAGQMLSQGIDSRLGRYVRAEKGYAYSVQGYFSPGRQAGAFLGQTDTRFETTADTINAMFKVLDDMKRDRVPAQELSEAQFRVAGQLLMSMQTVSEQAAQRITGILNGYPVDYYDKYAQRISRVSADEIKDVMNKYVRPEAMTIVVVGPAEALRTQLETLGPVQVVPMPPME